MDEDAVSPVLAVILMVAAVVVIAAATVLWLGTLSQRDEKVAEPIAFTRSDDTTGPGGNLQVVQVSGGEIAWTDLTLRDGAGGTPPCTMPTSGYVTGGDRIVCTGPGADGPFSLVRTSAKQVIFIVQFHAGS